MSHRHELDFTYFSQEHLLDAGCFDVNMAMAVAEKAMITYEQGDMLFPEKVVQIFNARTQARINCRPATMMNEKIRGMKWVSVFPESPKEDLHREVVLEHPHFSEKIRL